jgi:hypothetical protein
LLWGDVVVGESEGEAAVGKPRNRTQLAGRIQRPLVLADFFLNSHPVLLEGAALGSEAFVQAVYRSNRMHFGGDGTWRGDWLRLRSGMTQRWVVRGLMVLKPAAV